MSRPSNQRVSEKLTNENLFVITEIPLKEKQIPIANDNKV